MRRKLLEYLLKKKKMKGVPVNGPFFDAALDRLKSRNIAVETIIDVGASNGCWTEAVLPYYPQARCLCVEAQRAHEPDLSAFVAKHDNVEYVIAAAGDREGEIHFDASDLWGGVASESPVEENDIVVPVTTIDKQVERLALEAPFLIKLDTHGYEMPILAGAERALEQAAVLIIEVYNFDIAPTAVRFPELCLHLEKRGFRCVDMFDPSYRPYDNSLWQMDLVFIRSDRPEFQYNEFV